MDICKKTFDEIIKVGVMETVDLLTKDKEAIEKERYTAETELVGFIRKDPEDIEFAAVAIEAEHARQREPVDELELKLVMEFTQHAAPPTTPNQTTPTPRSNTTIPVKAFKPTLT
ncbi:hypothetical protein CCACVL1_30122 [Corchorus capsularis]|uniref:Uncharacterized protein n=1 Tax=Corchorus capsularis TaxID=210143 RepID=A0A1R3FYQ2_COCAP|nr:hypothetical protein CCACVL1_30122 [Corchorus capsularis]